MPRVTLYSKPECHLCDMVKEVISRVRARREFELEIRNILTDPVDHERYKNDIPVVMVDGVEIARYRLSEQRLEWGLNQGQKAEG
jgi:glutaredoxin